MKITKKQLRKIILEELASSPNSLSKLNEMGLAMDSSQYFDLTDDLRKNLFAELFKIVEWMEEMDEYDMADLLTNTIEDFASRHNINL
jgi:hypothetical protein